MRNRCGFSITDLLIVIAVLAILVALLLPALSTVRESARRSTCVANHKQLALAIKSYEEQRRSYPPAAYLTNLETGAEVYVEGKVAAIIPGSTEGDTRAPFSLYVKLLPYMEFGHLYDNYDFRSLPFADENLDYASAQIPGLICPTFTGELTSTADEYDDAAITNYKPLGATTWSVLNDAEDVINARGDGGVLHPYGYSRALKATSLTLLLCDTKEQAYAAWADGTTSAIPGFQPSVDTKKEATTPALNYREDEETVFLSAEDFGGSMAMQWGPSSEHPGIVNHSFADGSARALPDDIDPDVYKAMITRDTADNGPVGEFLSR